MPATSGARRGLLAANIKSCKHRNRRFSIRHARIPSESFAPSAKIAATSFDGMQKPQPQLAISAARENAATADRAVAALMAAI